MFKLNAKPMHIKFKEFSNATQFCVQPTFRPLHSFIKSQNLYSNSSRSRIQCSQVTCASFSSVPLLTHTTFRQLLQHQERIAQQKCTPDRQRLWQSKCRCRRPLVQLIEYAENRRLPSSVSSHTLLKVG